MSETLSAQKSEKEKRDFLIEAVKKGNYDNVKLAIDGYGASVNTIDDNGESVLMLAIQERSKLSISYLIQKGASVKYRASKNRIDEAPNNSKQYLKQARETKSVLKSAIKSGSSSILDDILSYSTDIDFLPFVEHPSVEASISLQPKMLEVIANHHEGLQLSPKDVWNALAYVVSELESDSLSFEDRKIFGFFEILSYWEKMHHIKIDKDKILASKFTDNPKYTADLIDMYNGYIEGRSSTDATDGINPISIPNPGSSNRSVNEYFDTQNVGERSYNNKIEIAIVIILSVSAIFYLKYGSFNKSAWIKFFKDLWYIGRVKPAKVNSVPATPSPRKQTNKQSEPSNDKDQERKTQNSKSLTLKEKRGWDTDLTKDLIVCGLTIEDKINPILLCNEHEKEIRRMMWYIRLLEEYSDEQIAQTLGQSGLLPHLEKLWQTIDRRFVRKVYIKSFVILVEIYSLRDSRVISFHLKLVEDLKPKKRMKEIIEDTLNTPSI